MRCNDDVTYLDAGQPEVVQRGSPWYETKSFSSFSSEYIKNVDLNPQFCISTYS